MADSGKKFGGRAFLYCVLVAGAWVAVAGAADRPRDTAHASTIEPASHVRGRAIVGTLAGTLRLAALPAEGGPPRLSPYSRRRYQSPTPTMGASGVEDAVVYVSTATSAVARTDTVVRVRQLNQQIIPHVTAVQVGTEVRFPNDDDIYHNLFSLSDPKPFNLGRYRPGESRSCSTVPASCGYSATFTPTCRQ